jgi:hypothetical protein
MIPQTIPRFLLVIFLVHAMAHGQEESNSGPTAKASLLLDMEGYFSESPSPGLLFEDGAFFQPRLSLFLEGRANDYLSFHGLLRADRGVDPGLAPDGEVRMDEYYLEARPWGDDRLALRVGKFATVFGSWAGRHHSWENPFVTPPSLYGDLTPITSRAAAISPAVLAGRRNAVTNKQTWLPLIWGPAYTSGLSLSGRVDTLSYALELKNVSPASQPERWDAIHDGFSSSPTITGRLGWQPLPEWNAGVSFSHGAYLDESTGSLPDLDDYAQTIVGIDVGYAKGHLQVWAELAYASFDVPGVGNVDTVSGFIEGKYKITAQWWAALRWNQSWYGDIPGLDVGWDRSAWRVDMALGYRFTENVQAKVQYSLLDDNGNGLEGRHLLALQLSLRY